MKINIKKKIEEFKRRHLLVGRLVLSTSGLDRNSSTYLDRYRYNSYIRMSRVYLNDTANTICIKIRIPEKTNIIFDKDEAFLIAKKLNPDYSFSGFCFDGRYEYIVLEGSKLKEIN